MRSSGASGVPELRYWISVTLPFTNITFISLTLNKPGEKAFGLTYPDIEALRSGQKSFEGIAASGSATISLTGKGKPERVSGMVVTANCFDTLGVWPILGLGSCSRRVARFCCMNTSRICALPALS
ncbi:MAG: hypothetical protein WB630_15125 [Candidatus Acidiferrales bacterium]